MKIFTVLAVVTAVVASPLSLQSRQSSSGGPTFSISNGTVRGITLSGLGVEQFLGIPYGQTTAGAGRFANPRPVNSSFSGTFDATVSGNICPGYGVSSYANPATGQFYNTSEDCLNVNIWRPANVNASANLPILFWIFGGGFVQGTANDPRYNGSYIVSRSVQIGQPVIVVGVNYRVAAFGFPAGNAAASAGVLNLGLKDQRLALRWLQSNAAGFGGNPQAVTIWGQSAGGSSVVWQNLAYGGRDDGLFRSSIVDSGVFVNQVNISLATKQAQWNALLNATGCSDDLACLRNVSFSALYAAANGTFSPSVIIDNDFVVANSLKLFANGSYPKLPIILGSNLDEATSGIGAPTGINTDADFAAVAARNFGVSLPNSTVQQLLQAFPNDPSRGCPYYTGDGVLPTGLQDKRVNDLFTSNIDAGVRYFASQRVRANAPTYRYHFTQVPQNGTIDAGVAHFYEIPYLFGVLNQTSRNPASIRPADLALSRAMQEYWIRFTNSGNPNGGNNTNWPTYGTGKQAMQLQNNAVQVITDDYRNDSISLLSSIAISL